jgi:hypothetical protein
MKMNLILIDFLFFEQFFNILETKYFFQLISKDAFQCVTEVVTPVSIQHEEGGIF